MKIIFHKDYLTCYISDPAASKGRLDGTVKILEKEYKFKMPNIASEELLKLNHSDRLISEVKTDKLLYNVARLAVGGAVLSSELAVEGEPAFALIRPPGHHASPDSHWGFCYFNNIAIAVKNLLKNARVDKVLIVDFDLHFGDGTENSLRNYENVTYHHPEASNSVAFIKSINELLFSNLRYEILGVSAGFDRGINDWGGMLTDEDYMEIGAVLKRISEEKCSGRRFSLLEGGYNHNTLGETIRSFLKGFE